MSFSRITPAQLALRGATTLPDQPTISATALKQEFDAPAKDVVAPKVNGLMDELEATTASQSLGASTPPGRAYGTTVQGMVNGLSSDLATAEANITDLQTEKLDDAFTSIKVGGATIPTSGPTELEFVQGSNVTLAVSGNAITISSSGGGGGGGGASKLEELDDVVITAPTPGQALVYNGLNWLNGVAGLLPVLPIASESTATVTVIQDATGDSVPVTSAGSGHWICEIPEFGYYTIHSVLAGQGDATARVYIDEVKIYDEVTDNHYDHTITFTAPNGSTVRVSGGGESRTETGTGASQSVVVHNKDTSYSVTVEMDGNGKPYTFTTPSTTGQTTTIPSGTFDFGTINVSVAADFVTAGSTITCVNGGTSCTPKPAASSLTFRVPSTGTWTISGSISGTPYSVDAEVTSLSVPVSRSLETLPDGSTVLPTDDIQTWLKCAGITDKAYTTLAQVLADTDTLVALCADSNACDYMTRSTTWASGVTTDADAMNIVGKYDYCANALLSDATWASAIVSSTYIDSISSDLIPEMTDNTHPSGECSASSKYSGVEPFKAFDGDEGTTWLSSGAAPQWLQYEADNTYFATGFTLVNGRSTYLPSTFILKATNTPSDASSWVELTGTLTNTSSAAAGKSSYAVSKNWGFYKCYRLDVLTGSSLIEITTLQLQGYKSKNYTGTVIHSAVEDVTYYVSGGSNVPFCTIASGDTGTVSSSVIDSLKGQTINLCSSVAKDPDNLSNDYSKQIRITPNVTEIYLMPDNALYWWGYIDKECEELSTANGWSSSGATFSSPTYSKNNAVLSASTTTYVGIGSKLSNAITSAHSIIESTNLDNNVGLRTAILTSKAMESGTSTDYAHQVTAQTVANTIQKIDVTYTASYCCAVAWQNSRAGKLYALWYE